MRPMRHAAGFSCFLGVSLFLTAPARAFEPEEFTPFEPGTRNEPLRSSRFRLPDGRDIASGAFFEELNLQQRLLARFNRSLKERDDSLGVVGEMAQPASGIAAQDRSLKDEMTHLQEQGVQPLDFWRARQSRPDPERLERACAWSASLARPLDDSGLSKETRWEHFMGESERFGVRLRGTVIRSASAEALEGDDRNACAQSGLGRPAHAASLFALAETEAEAHIFNTPVSLARTVVDGKGGFKGSEARARFYVLGFQVAVKRKDGEKSVTFGSDELSQSTGFYQTVPFLLGSVPMSAKYGVKFKAELPFSFDLSPGQARALMEPTLDASVVAEAGADIVVAGAGLGGGVSLARTTLPLEALATLDVQPSAAPSIVLDGAIDATFSTLSGKLFAFFETWVPQIWIPPFKKKKWELVFWKWPGFVATGPVARGQSRIPLPERNGGEDSLEGVVWRGPGAGGKDVFP